MPTIALQDIIKEYKIEYNLQTNLNNIAKKLNVDVIELTTKLNSIKELHPDLSLFKDLKDLLDNISKNRSHKVLNSSFRLHFNPQHTVTSTKDAFFVKGEAKQRPDYKSFSMTVMSWNKSSLTKEGVIEALERQNLNLSIDELEKVIEKLGCSDIVEFRKKLLKKDISQEDKDNFKSSYQKAISELDNDDEHESKKSITDDEFHP